jgi:predicted nuclease of predicted toxin-antitoxin system
MVIITKDSDFSHRIMLSSSPPWIVFLRFGNMRRADFLLLLARVWPQVEELLPANKLISVFSDRIEAIADHL